MRYVSPFLKLITVKNVGKHSLFDFHMGNNISTSIVNIMAEMITADNAEVGIYLQYGVKKAHALRMRSAVTQPANVVRTPLAACIADRPKDAVTGIEPINDPTNWHTPKATISWDASIVLPGAITNKMRKLSISEILYVQWQKPNHTYLFIF